MRRPAVHTDPGPIVDAILDHAAGAVVLGLPLGLGKAPAIANALYQRAERDRSISLRIVTALTLEAPQAGSELERRFLGPVNERCFGGYPTIAYARALRDGTLPPNIEINEFFLQAGQWLDCEAAQRSYISANYTHAAGYLRDRGVNVIAQLVAPGEGERDRVFSLSCNPDLTLDLGDLFSSRNGPCLLVGQANAELPYMPGEASLPASDFDHILTGHEFPLVAPPNPPVSDADHAIGTQAAALVPDGGTIQIGIGSIGDAFSAALLMRHEAPKLFHETLEKLGPTGTLEQHTAPFEQGLYAASEMVVPSFLDLWDRGVLKRRAGDGSVLHGGFFLGPRDFYRRLREVPEEKRAELSMREISWVNSLYGSEAQKRIDRRDARFVNNAMMATLLGEVVSDSLDDGRVVSGVGGQYNFVAQAFALDGARSVITVNAARMQGGRRVSNICWTYGATTIPRHLRDLVVTEYGVADLRGRTDAECIERMLGIADSEFQTDLCEEAGPKIRRARLTSQNVPERISEALAKAREEGWCARFPFGTDFSSVEQRLIPALDWLRDNAATSWARIHLGAKALTTRLPEDGAALGRLGLREQRTIREKLFGKLIRLGLKRTSDANK